MSFPIEAVALSEWRGMVSQRILAQTGHILNGGGLPVAAGVICRLINTLHHEKKDLTDGPVFGGGVQLVHRGEGADETSKCL